MQEAGRRYAHMPPECSVKPVGMSAGFTGLRRRVCRSTASADCSDRRATSLHSTCTPTPTQDATSTSRTFGWFTAPGAVNQPGSDAPQLLRHVLCGPRHSAQLVRQLATVGYPRLPAVRLHQIALGRSDNTSVPSSKVYCTKSATTSTSHPRLHRAHHHVRHQIRQGSVHRPGEGQGRRQTKVGRVMARRLST